MVPRAAVSHLEPLSPAGTSPVCHKLSSAAAPVLPSTFWPELGAPGRSGGCRDRHWVGGREVQQSQAWSSRISPPGCCQGPGATQAFSERLRGGCERARRKGRARLRSTRGRRCRGSGPRQSASVGPSWCQLGDSFPSASPGFWWGWASLLPAPGTEQSHEAFRVPSASPVPAPALPRALCLPTGDPPYLRALRAAGGS